jgi:hypothetical protein
MQTFALQAAPTRIQPGASRDATRVEGRRWAIEDSFETAKSELGPPKNDTQDLTRTSPLLIRWSVQEIRRIATRLAQRRIQPAHIIAWSLWRRAHQASAQQAHNKTKA